MGEYKEACVDMIINIKNKKDHLEFDIDDKKRAVITSTYETKRDVLRSKDISSFGKVKKEGLKEIEIVVS